MLVFGVGRGTSYSDGHGSAATKKVGGFIVTSGCGCAAFVAELTRYSMTTFLGTTSFPT